MGDWEDESTVWTTHPPFSSHQRSEILCENNNFDIIDSSSENPLKSSLDMKAEEEWRINDENLDETNSFSDNDNFWEELKRIGNEDNLGEEREGNNTQVIENTSAERISQFPNHENYEDFQKSSNQNQTLQPVSFGQNINQPHNENTLIESTKKRTFEEALSEHSYGNQLPDLSKSQHKAAWKNDIHQTFEISSQEAQKVDVANHRQNQFPPSLNSHILPSHPTCIPIPMKTGYLPTWKRLIPRDFLSSLNESARSITPKRYQLSLLNLHEFTITGLSVVDNTPPSSVSGLRTIIRQISRQHGKAIFEADNDSPGGARWRIPIGAYHAFYSYLTSIPDTKVYGIPQVHLNIAMLGIQRLEKECPSVEKLLLYGVPSKIAKILAPFQRKGVDFVHERNGKALIADEMGLGKTIQSIASIAMYYNDWPVLVLTPSGARYHWQHEFLNWLGQENNDSKILEFDSESQKLNMQNTKGVTITNNMEPLLEKQIHVVGSGNTPLIPSPDTKIVIVSYGLAPKLVEEKKLNPGDFKCAIVDESHMLKNKNSKRTKELMPILAATKRCILLSGTPAFARPIELWPQISILGSAEDPSLSNESVFVAKYVKGRGKNRLAELHAVLTGTIMIRRMKNDILKQLPPKVREQALVNVLDESTRPEFRAFLEIIRKGKGALGTISRKQQMAALESQAVSEDDSSPAQLPLSVDQIKAQVQEEANQFYEKKRSEIDQFCNSNTDPNVQSVVNQALNTLRKDVDTFYHSRLRELKVEHLQRHKNKHSIQPGVEDPQARKSALIKMYQRTGQVKIPLVAELLTLWLKNPANGKLCIFAHHISVLNEIGSIVGLSNEADSDKKFIRIDGSTSPKQRQEQIAAFQTNPTIRVAMLGLTAAGVAVTLTASSTVWFAELFWTPALLIQAEDRCHRIGQQAKCRCLYIVAKGTLDEILWKHIENKFRDLGEFVEGKEKLKLVVHKVYVGSSSLKESMNAEAFFCDDQLDRDEESIDHNSEVDEDLEPDLHKEIQEMELEEQEMVKANVTGEDDDFDADCDGKHIPKHGSTLSTMPGSTETEAICLSDDESDENLSTDLMNDVGINPNREFPEATLFKANYSQENLTFRLVLFNGRLVVQSKDQGSPSTSKPDVGDILLACNNDEIPPNAFVECLLDYFRILLRLSKTIELVFATDQEFTRYFLNQLNLRLIDMHPLMMGSDPTGLVRRVTNLPTYLVTFDTNENLGFRYQSIQDLILVTAITFERKTRYGANAIPYPGDVILSINGSILTQGISVPSVKSMLDSLRERSATIEIRFAAADSYISALVPGLICPPNVSSNDNRHFKRATRDMDVIELLDD
jgi:hypothetical protein